MTLITHMDSDEIIVQLTSILQENLIAGGFTTAITSRHTNAINLSRGYANIGSEEPIDENRLFGIGSITKVFVAVVVFQLAGEGQLKLTDTVDQFLSKDLLHGIDNAEAATIDQLLSHTAGIDSWEEDPAWIVDGRGKNINLTGVWRKTDTLDYLRRPRRTAPEPGNWYYSNTNYTLLGLIIEHITHRTLESEVRRRILEPLGMNDTFFEGFEEPPASKSFPCRYHYATPQFRETAGVSDAFPEVASNVVEVTGSNLSVSWAAGGMISTTSDLCRFALGLRDGRLLNLTAMRLLYDWIPTTIDGHEMGHGIFRISIPGKGRWIGHSGGVLGFSTGLWWKEGEDCVVSVMSNLGIVHAGKVQRGVGNLVLKSDFLGLAPQALATSSSSSTLPRMLSTSRLTIRLLDAGSDTDCQAIIDFYRANGAGNMKTPSDVREKVESNRISPTSCSKAFPPDGTWHLVFEKDSSNEKAIGMVGFGQRKDCPGPDLGYALDPQHRGKGYASEAGQAVLEFWREQVGVEEIFAATGKDNIASQRVAERIGFVRHGKWIRVANGAVDEGVLYVLPSMVGKTRWQELTLTV